LSFLNGRATALTVFWTDFLRDVALLEVREDLVDKVSADCTILSAKRNEQLAYLCGPIYTLSEPICNILIFISNVGVLNIIFAQQHWRLGAQN